MRKRVQTSFTTWSDHTFFYYIRKKVTPLWKIKLFIYNSFDYFYFNCGNLKLALAEIFIAFLLFFFIPSFRVFYYSGISEDVGLGTLPRTESLNFKKRAIFLVCYFDINDDNVGRFYTMI